MRSKTVLLQGFDNIKILQQYLYLSEENYVEVENSIGVKLRINMSDDTRYKCINMNFPDLPAIDYTSNIDIGTMLSIIATIAAGTIPEPPKIS